MDNLRKFTHVLTKTLRIHEDEITDALSPADVKTWDSLNALLLTAELERTFGVRFTLTEMMAVKCVGDIKTLLRKHSVDLP